jgi:hypothetical protein
LEEQLDTGRGGCSQLHPGTGGCSSAHGEHARDDDQARRGHACCGSPGREAGERTLSRLGFIGAGVVATAGALGGYTARAGAATTAQVWGLDPDGDGGDPGSCGCGSCAACRSHAANKWFAGAAAADAGRAHPYCNCTVVRLVHISEGSYDALFVDGGARDSVDLRSQWVQAVLSESQDAADALAAERQGVLRAVVRPASVLQSVNGRRVLYVDVIASEVVAGTVSVTRDGRTLAHNSLSDVFGTRRIRLEIPHRTRPGPARLWLTLRDASGRSKVVTRMLQIPRVLQPSLPR